MYHLLYEYWTRFAIFISYFRIRNRMSSHKWDLVRSRAWIAFRGGTLPKSLVYLDSRSKIFCILHLLFTYFHCHGIHLHAVTAGTPEVHTVSYYLLAKSVRQLSATPTGICLEHRGGVSTWFGLTLLFGNVRQVSLRSNGLLPHLSWHADPWNDWRNEGARLSWYSSV